MYIYNVTIKVTPVIAEAWLRWMREEHMPALKATGLFTECRLCRLLEQDDTDGPTYAAQYFCNTLADYEAYLTEYAPSMREQSVRTFGDQAIAFRTLMRIEA